MEKSRWKHVKWSLTGSVHFNWDSFENGWNWYFWADALCHLLLNTKRREFPKVIFKMKLLFESVCDRMNRWIIVWRLCLRTMRGDEELTDWEVNECARVFKGQQFDAFTGSLYLFLSVFVVVDGSPFKGEMLCSRLYVTSFLFQLHMHWLCHCTERELMCTFSTALANAPK